MTDNEGGDIHRRADRQLSRRADAGLGRDERAGFKKRRDAHREARDRRTSESPVSFRTAGVPDRRGG